MTHLIAVIGSLQHFRRALVAAAAAGVAVLCLAASVARASEPPIVLTGKLQERDVVFNADSLKTATIISGIWKIEVGGEGCAAPQQWLQQTARTNDANVIVMSGAPLADVDIRVNFMPIAGRADAAGGIVFRFDRGRYYVVRANALEDNLRLYAVDGQQRELASARVTQPELGRWHTLRVVAQGNHLQAYLNDKIVLDLHDLALSAGGIGLWTKADSVTAFDGLSIRGTPALVGSASR